MCIRDRTTIADTSTSATLKTKDSEATNTNNTKQTSANNSTTTTQKEYTNDNNIASVRDITQEPISVSNANNISAPDKTEEKIIGETISPSKDLNELININDKFQFTRELFDNNAPSYKDTISKLNTVSSFENAKKIISSFNWNEEDETVIHFTEIITRKFN